MTRQDIIAFAMPVLIGIAMIFGTTCSHAQSLEYPVNTAFMDWQVTTEPSVLMPPAQYRALIIEISLATWDATYWLQVDQSSDLIHWKPILTNEVQDVFSPKIIMQVNIGAEPLRLFRFGTRTNL